MERSFPRDINALGQIFDFVSDFLERLNPSEEVKYFVEFTVEEIFTNMVKYNSSKASEISIRLRQCEGECIEVRLIDRNVDRFDITQVERIDTDRPLERWEVGGLGLHLIRKLADTIKYEYIDGDSVITITKNVEG